MNRCAKQPRKSPKIRIYKGDKMNEIRKKRAVAVVSVMGKDVIN